MEGGAQVSDHPLTDEAILASGGQWTFLLRDLCRRLEQNLDQERQDRKQADLDTIRALGERNEARAKIAVWKHDVKRLEAELETFDEKAIEWWCEYQDLKAKARET